MAELAITTGHGGEGASFNTVFIDTTLDTHLAVVVSSSDTVADLKKKIIEEHLVCFPECGAIRIAGLKVKKRGLYYHLAESMLVKCAFEGIKKKSWFLCVEASVIDCKGKEIEGIQNYEEEGNLAVVNVNEKNVFEDGGVGLVLGAPRGVVGDGDLLVATRNEPSSSFKQNGSCGAADGLEVAETAEAQLRGGDQGDIGHAVGSESRREEKSDGQAQDVEVQVTKSKIDGTGSVLPVGYLNHHQELEVQVMENRMDSSVLQGGDLNDNSNIVKEKRTKRKRSCKKVESKKDDLVSESSDKPSMKTFEHKPVGKKLKTGKEGRSIVSESTEMNFESAIVSQLPVDVDGKIKRKKKSSEKLVEEISAVVDDISQKQVRSNTGNMVSELNDMTSEPPTVSQLPIGDDQQLVNPTVEAKKKRKKKSSNKMDKEVNVVDEQSLKEAGGNNANVRSGPNDMTCEPPTMSQLPIGDEQQLINAVVESSDAGAKKFSNKIAKEVNAVNEQSLKDGRSDNVNVVSEPNDMNCDPPTVSQLPVGDVQQLVNATVKGSEAKVKKKRKTKSSKKIDREVNAVDEQSMNEAGGDDGNVVSEPNDMTDEPPTVSQLPRGGKQQVVNASDADTRKKRKRKSSSKMDKEANADVEQSLKEAGTDVEQSLKEAGTDDGNVPCHAPPAIVQQEADEHMLQPSAMSLKDKETSPVREAHHNNLHSQDINDFQEPVPDEMHRVTTEKVAVIQTFSTEVQKEVHSQLGEAVPSLCPFIFKKRKKSRKQKDLSSGATVTSDLGSDVPVKDGEEAVVEEISRASLLATEDEINEVIKNVVDSVPETTEGKAVVEVKESKSKKKPKTKLDSDAKISLPTQAEDENIPVPPTVNIEDGDLDKVTSKLPGTPSLTGKGGSEANPHVGSSGRENKRKEVQQPNAASKLKEAEEEHHHSESSTNSTSKPKRSNKAQSLTQTGNVNPKPLGGSSSILKRNLFGDGSDDSLETYVFPSERQSSPSIPDTYADVSSTPDGESDAGFDGETRNSSGDPLGMKTPF
ncbi:hypothetical protein LINGRAHAP2_LOCUS27116 [Linum grandiflorum]